MSATLEFYIVPHPLRAGELAVVDRRAATEALEAARHGVPLRRVAYVPRRDPSEDSQPDQGNDLEATLRHAEQRLVRHLLGQRRRLAARGWLWLLVGVALTLIWVNVAIVVGGIVAFGGSFVLPGIAGIVGAVIGTLGSEPGGPVLAAAVGLLPAVWGLRRAKPHRAEARRHGHLARLLRSQQGKGDALEVQHHPSLQDFLAAGQEQIARLRRQLDRLPGEPLPATATLADDSQAIVRLAHHYGLKALAAPFREIARLSEALERRLGELERRGGALDERRSSRAVSRTRKLLQQALDPYALGSQPTDHRAALALAVTLGGLALVLGYVLAGGYWVFPQQAIVIDSPLDRLERLGRSLGLGFLPAQPTQRPQVVQQAGPHLSWPRPFGARQTVSLAPQSLIVRAIVRPIAPPRYEFVAVLVQYRIIDPARWALVSRESNIEETLNAGLSQGLQEYMTLQLQAVEASLLQQNPQLQDESTRLQQATYQVVRENMRPILGNFFAEEVDPEALAENIGIELAPVDYNLVDATLTDG